MAAAARREDGRRAAGRARRTLCGAGSKPGAGVSVGVRRSELIARERERFEAKHARSRQLHEEARASLLAGVPMSWMAMWVGGFPLYLERAFGATLIDVDANEYADFCLGDTGAMAGHSPEATMAAVRDVAGITTMLPTDDAAWVGGELASRFDVPLWSFTLTATDANRFAIRWARHITGRPKILVHNHCYHGTVDETFAELDGAGEV